MIYLTPSVLVMQYMYEVFDYYSGYPVKTYQKPCIGYICKLQIYVKCQKFISECAHEVFSNFHKSMNSYITTLSLTNTCERSIREINMYKNGGYRLIYTFKYKTKQYTL